MTIDISSQPTSVPAVPVSKQTTENEVDQASSFASLKDRIKSHYDICSNYYLSLW